MFRLYTLEERRRKNAGCFEAARRNADFTVSRRLSITVKDPKEFVLNENKITPVTLQRIPRVVGGGGERGEGGGRREKIVGFYSRIRVISHLRFPS